MMRQYSENCGGPSSGECQEFQEDLSSLSSGGRQTFQEEDLNDPGGWYYQQLELGYNYRLTDIASALGCSQMDKLDRFLEARRAIAARYDEAFRDIPEILCPQQMEGCESGWHLYTIQCLGRDRRAVFDQLRAAGLGVNVHYIPVYRHPYYQKNGYAGVYCPKAEEFYSRAITLPIFPALTQEQQEYVIRNVIAACRQPKI